MAQDEMGMRKGIGGKTPIFSEFCRWVFLASSTRSRLRIEHGHRHRLLTLGRVAARREKLL
jgi:hypothetical protein